MSEKEKPKGFIALDERSYVSHVWFVGWKGVDLLVCLYKPDAAQADWDFKWRFRYHETTDVRFGEDDIDEKHCFGASFVCSEDEAVATAQKWLNMTVPLSPQGPAPIERVTVQGGVEAFHRALASMPWVTSKTEEERPR